MGAGAIEVGVIGLGVGEQHARAFARTEGCAVRWLYDLDTERTAKVRDAIGQGAAATSYEQMLADPNVSLISIATYDDQHPEQVVAALRAGKHVFCEKPLCRTAEELSAIRSAWDGSGHALACNLVLRAAPLYRWLREAIRSGELGEIYAFDGDYLYGRVEKITTGWRKDVADYSVMAGGGVHLVDLMLWLLDERPNRVTAVGNRIATRDTAFRYDDFTAATFQFPSGRVGRISANFGCVHRHQHVVRVFGTKATFLYDDRGARLHTSRDPAVAARTLDASPVPPSKGDLIPAFVADIRGSGGRASTQHEFDLVAACLAADHAVLTSQPIDIGYQ